MLKWTGPPACLSVVLCYVLNKGQYFDSETSFTQSCFTDKIIIDDKKNAICLNTVQINKNNGRKKTKINCNWCSYVFKDINFGIKGTLNPHSTPLNNEPIAQVLKQVVHLSCFNCIHDVMQVLPFCTECIFENNTCVLLYQVWANGVWINLIISPSSKHMM